MDDNGQRENGRHKADQYRSVHGQWLMPQYQMKDNHTIKLLTERDQAIRERNIALSEKKLALAERDMAILQRDAAVAERNTAIVERDNAIAALEHARENAVNGSCERGCPKQNHHHNHHQQPRHHHDHPSPPPQLSMDPYDHSREMHIAEAYPISVAPDIPRKVRKPKQSRNQPHVEATTPHKKASKPATRKRVSGGEWMDGEDLNKQGIKHPNEWKDQDSGLNQVAFDETTMPVPVCSCTGKYQPCYKWGNGGWQSACCTTTLSVYPLPVMANKRHSRMGGRKMSGNVFTRVLSRMAAEGHDLSVPLDLKDHWSKHGTNRYITIK